MRDAAFTLYALIRLGFIDSCRLHELAGGARRDPDRDPGPLQLMYRIDGREDLPEEEFTHLEGYRGSGPVRIGNGAASDCNSTSTAN